MKPFLPYRPMNENQPLALQMEFIPVRRWAVQFAGAVFQEFEFRFHKTHASKIRYESLVGLIEQFDPGIRKGKIAVRFTFVAKGDGVFHGKTMSQAIHLYRQYYRSKLSKMKVPVVYTGREKPSWI